MNKLQSEEHGDKQFDVVFNSNDNSIIYDYHRYLKRSQQPKSLRTNEIAYDCYKSFSGCKNKIRIRRISGIWICTRYNMHDFYGGRQHKRGIGHALYTPNSNHIRNIELLAKQEAMLSSTASSRRVCENQILQNPKLNMVKSVRNLQTKIGNICMKGLISFPLAPSCTEAAAASLRRYPIWGMNFYTHCEYVLKEKLDNNEINITINLDDLFKNNEEKSLVEGQMKVNEVMLQLKSIKDIIELSRMKLNASDLKFDFLIHMRWDGALIIFGHRCGFKILKECDTIGFDQLCRVCPNLGGKKAWQQSWILHGLFESQSIELMDENFPAFLCLMIDHTEDTYHEILHALMVYVQRTFDPSYVTLTGKRVRLMGDWSMGEHNTLNNSEYVEVKKDDGCGFHFINRVNANMKSKGYIKYYYDHKLFRKYVRYFECLRAIHLDCAELACDLIKRKSWNAIGGEARNAFREFYNDYLEPIWRRKFGLEMLNCQGSYVMDNNYSEGWNRKTLMDIGMRKSWWPFLFELKRFFAIICARYEAFEKNKFERPRSLKRKDRLRALDTIWNKFENLDRKNEVIVCHYLF